MISKTRSTLAKTLGGGDTGDPSPWPYGWIAFGAACAAVVIGLVMWIGLADRPCRGANGLGRGRNLDQLFAAN